MYYSIADVTLRSEISLPSFATFACDPAEPDVTLCLTEEEVPAGREISSGDIVHRVLPDGWYCHGRWGAEEGMLISRDCTVLRYRAGKGAVRGSLAERYVRLALECVLARRGFVSIHAAAVELDGKAFLFAGPSGVGKSTRARVWTEKLGAGLISGDRPLLRVDTLEVYGVPWDGKEQCFRPVRVPLAALCEVRRGKRFRVRKLTPFQSRRLLVRQCFLPMWDTETAAVQMRNIIRLSQRGNILRVFSGRSQREAVRLRDTVIRGRELGEETDMKAKPGFTMRHVAGEYVLMPTDENIGIFNSAVLFNSVSAFIWEKLQNDLSRDDLLALVMDAFDVDEATAARDLDELLARMDEMDLIERS